MGQQSESREKYTHDQYFDMMGIGDMLLNWRHDWEPSGRSLESSTRDRTTSLLCGSGSQDSTHFVQIVLLPIPQPWPMITSQDHKI